MGTGISAILLHQMPYTNVVFETMGTVLYVLNVLLFVTFILMTAARYMIWPGILPVMLKHEGQSLFLGTLPMGFATLVNLTVFIAVPAFGQRCARARGVPDPLMLLSFVRLAEAMWWIDVALTVLIGLAFPVVIFTRHRHELGGVNGVMLQPFVAAVVAAASGGIVASVLPADRARVVILASCVISRPISPTPQLRHPRLRPPGRPPHHGPLSSPSHHTYHSAQGAGALLRHGRADVPDRIGLPSTWPVRSGRLWSHPAGNSATQACLRRSSTYIPACSRLNRRGPDRRLRALRLLDCPRPCPVGLWPFLAHRRTGDAGRHGDPRTCAAVQSRLVGVHLPPGASGPCLWTS